MKDFRIIYDGTDPVSLPDGTDLGVIGEHNAVKLVISLPASMVDGMTYHVVTVGGVDSAFIVDTEPNVDGAFRVENVIYMPLVAAFTHNRIADVTVTAYKQTGDVVQVVDKTPTAYGLTFSEGQPQEIVGGLVAEVKALENEVDAIRDDLPTSEEIERWNHVAVDAYTHTDDPVLGKLSETESGLLMYDGKMIGVDVVDTPNDLDADAKDGATAAACFEIPAEHLVYPEQTADEAVQIDYSDEALTIGNPKYSDSAIDALISDFSSWPTATIETENSEAQLLVNVIPVVPDISDNDYVTAGIEISADGCIVDANATSKYALSMSLINSASAFVNPNKIIEVDETHIAAPAAAFCVFEDIDGVIDEIEGQLTKGWNIMLVTVELPSYEPTAVSFVNNININDWIVYPNNMSGILEVYGTKATILLKGIYDVISEAKNKGLYVHENGVWQLSGDVQDYTPLSFKEYSGLVVRDLVRDYGVQDVPVYNVGSTGSICKMLDASDQFISLEEARQPNGDPVRFVKVFLNGTYYVFLPVPLEGAGATIPAGWSSGGQTVDAPSLAGFTPVKMEVGNMIYEDLSILPADAKLALGSLSQCINESADALGHINIPDDAVIRYAGKIEQNRKYYFSTGFDVSFDLPDVEDSKTDAQFVMYLNCSADNVDLSFPADTVFSGDVDSSQGKHKLIGCWLKDERCWAVGCLSYEEASA